MKKSLFLILLSLSFAGCHAQNNPVKKDASATDTARDKPIVTWKVNKQYDEKGDLVGYDSSYSWTYSGKGDISHEADADSVMAAFRKQLDAGFPSYLGGHLQTPAGSDSLFYQDFLNPDYFSDQWGKSFSEMDSIFRRIDSINNSFFIDNYPRRAPQPESLFEN